MLNNFLIIGIFVVVLSILAVIFGLIFMKGIVPFCESVGKKLAKKISSKYWIYFFEILFLSTIVTFAIIGLYLVSFSEYPFIFVIVLFIFTILIIIETSAYNEFRNKNNISKTSGIIGWIVHRAVWKSYIAKRILLFIEQLAHTFYLIVPFYLSLLIMSELTWSDQDYFYILLFLPIYANIWVYLRFSRKMYIVNFNSYETLFMRRLIIYTLIIGYSIMESYNKFSHYLSNKNILSFEYLFVYSAVIVYIAVDRLLKEIVSDVEKFKKEKSETEKLQKE
ncbi:hypothetical protein [Paenibacillus xylanexedens]|uniref:hypothetical protein n=1 Tax=Paenibacillus xylanexedens TaxID=528191 RepID=UPI000F52CFB3|nr:hypothetical protein [Paenibacillus xylanexedens]RPK29529.1 hypothetical protein EDO6_00152 [Paenibacillus xylanexedens]